VELYFNSPNTPSWHGAQLKRRDSFTFTLLCFTFYVILIHLTKGVEFEGKDKKSRYDAA